MSHSKERAEKICLNCSTELNGRFCHICGQENLEPKESLWSLISHFFYDITHFDGKFFSTLKYLVRKPGFLSREFINGRRASYLNPIKMYVFTSALFFIIFYAMFDVSKMNIGLNDKRVTADSARVKLERAKSVALQSAETHDDSLRILDGFRFIENSSLAPVVKSDSGNSEGPVMKLFGMSLPNSQSKYDSIQRNLPASQRHNWLQRTVNSRTIEINRRYAGRGNEFIKDVIDKFLHTFPYLLFVSLPLYALFLKLLYIRRKKFYFVDHGIFLVHLYIFTFIILLFLFGLKKLHDMTDWSIFIFIPIGLLLYGIYYTIIAMKNFYAQGRGKTILKFILFNILAFISINILFAIFFMATLFRV